MISEDGFNLILVSVIQSAVVFVIIFIVYKFIIVKESSKIYGKIIDKLTIISNDLIPGLKYLIHQAAKVKEEDLVDRLKAVETRIVKKDQENYQNNMKVFESAGWILVFLTAVSIAMIGLSYYFKIKIIWITIIISIMMTGLGSMFEYYYVKYIIIRHFMFELPQLYDQAREGFYSKVKSLIEVNGWENELKAQIAICNSQ
jgi:hypothetical protein